MSNTDDGSSMGSGQVHYTIGYTIVAHSFDMDLSNGDESVQAKAREYLTTAILAACDAAHVGDYAGRWYVGFVQQAEDDSDIEKDEVTATLYESELGISCGWADIRTYNEGVTFN